MTRFDDGVEYAGTVEAVLDGGRAEVLYDDGETEVVGWPDESVRVTRVGPAPGAAFIAPAAPRRDTLIAFIRDLAGVDPRALGQEGSRAALARFRDRAASLRSRRALTFDAADIMMSPFPPAKKKRKSSTTKVASPRRSTVTPDQWARATLSDGRVVSVRARLRNAPAAEKPRPQSRTTSPPWSDPFFGLKSSTWRSTV